MNKLLICLSATVATLSAIGASAATEVTDKHHPGHYFYTTSSTISITEVPGFDLPGFAGWVKRYTWRQLEPKKGEYHFEAIRKDLEECRKYGKGFAVMIYDKTFSKGGNPCPNYLEPVLIHNNLGGTIPIRWDDFYVERYSALVQAIGKEFDSDPNFEGINIQETALSMTDKELAALPDKYPRYSEEVYADAIEKYVKAASKALPNSRVFWFGNFTGSKGIPPELPGRFIECGNVVFSGPDLVIYRQGYRNSIYPLFKKYEGKLLLGSSLQGDSFHHNKYDTYNSHPHNHSSEGGFIPVEDIFLFGRDSLHLNYIFWSYPPNAQPTPGENTWDDALAVIKKYPTFNR